MLSFSLSVALFLSQPSGAFAQAGARATEFAVKAWNSAQAYRFTDRAVRKVIANGCGVSNRLWPGSKSQWGS